MKRSMIAAISRWWPPLGGVAGPPTAEFLMTNFQTPAGVPDPVVWFSPRSVTLDGSSNVTTIVNEGSGGDTYDATAQGAAGWTIPVTAGWGGRRVFTELTDANAYFSMSSVSVRTVLAIATYKDGLDTTFDSYDGLYGGGANLDFVGNSGGASTFSGIPDNLIVDGAVVADGTAVLPMAKRVVGSNETVLRAITTVFADDFQPTFRNWIGQCGDILMFTETLTSEQLTLVNDMLVEYYA